MIKTFIFIGLIALTASAQNCQNNPFASALSITVKQNPTTGDDLKFCKYLSTSGNCCSVSEVEKISQNVEAAQKTLEDKAGARDKVLAPAFKNVNDNLNKLLTTYRAINGLDFMRTISGAGESFQSFQNFESDFKKELESVQKDFDTYQTERKKCFDEVLDIRASSYCMACDPNWESKGIESNGAINFSNDAKLRFSGACYDFVTKSANIARIIFMEKYTKVMETKAARLLEFLQGFNKFYLSVEGEKNPAALASFFTEISMEFGLTANNLETSFKIDMGQISDNSLTSTETVSKGVGVPSGCSSATSCDYFATNFMKNGGSLEFDSVLLGGEAKDTIKLSFKTGERFGNNNRRLLRFIEKELFGNGLRVLATTGQWNPQKNEAGVSVVVKADPASQAAVVQTYKSAVRLMASVATFAIVILAFIF